MNNCASTPATPARTSAGARTLTATIPFNIRWLGLTWEVAAIWYVILVLACVSALAVFDSVRLAELDSVRRASLSLFLTDLREEVETDIRLGFTLNDDRGAQAKIDELIRKDKTLRSIEIFDVSGKSQANTDRGSIGETVAPEWMRAMNVSSSALWTLANNDEIVLGLPLKGGFGEISGQIAVTYAPRHHDVGGSTPSHRHHLALLMLALLLIFAIPFFATIRYARSIEHQENILTGASTDTHHGEDDDVWMNAVHITTDTKRQLESVMQKLDTIR